MHLLPTKEALPSWIIEKELSLCIEMEHLRGRSLECFIGENQTRPIDSDTIGPFLFYERLDKGTQTIN